jgi:hypothetical protein
MRPRGRPESANSRGQSETLGFVLVFSLLIIGALVVVGLGATAIGDTEKQLSDDRAEKTLTQFDSKAGLVALEESDSQRVSLPNDDDGQFFVDEDSGWMAVVIENRSTGSTQEIFNTSLGAMTYENGRTTFAYQGGGVWRATESGGQMISPPEFHYRNGTLTLPAVSVTGEKSVDGTAVIKQNGTTKKFPTASPLANKTNPLSRFEVSVVVGSDYYKGWGQYFEERTDGAVKYDDSAETATLELVAPGDYPPVSAGILSGTTGTLEIKNTDIRSYNSTAGAYGTNHAKVGVAGDLHIKNGGRVFGDLELGGELTAKNNAEVRDGNISYGTSSAISSCADSRWYSCADNWINDNASITMPPSVNRLIEEQIANRRDSANNDNDDEDDISSNQIVCTGADCEIGAGEYYLEGISLMSEDVTFNTTGGDINIAVDGEVYLDNNRMMSVEGTNRVNLYVNETFTGENGYKAGNVTNTGSTSPPHPPATQFWVYTKTNQDVILQNDGVFSGVVYGPGGSFSEGTDISVGGGASGCSCEIYGGLLGDIPAQVNNANLYFDEALTKKEPVTVPGTIVKITYLHITVNEIRIED